MDASNLTVTEFKVVVIRMFNSMKREIEITKKDQSEIKNMISEMKNTLEGINSRMDEAEDQMSDLEDKVEKTPIQSSKKKNI